MGAAQAPRTLRRLWDVTAEVHREALRAHRLHASRSFAVPATYTADARLKYLVEEVGEVARALQGEGDLRTELVQVAHLAAVWVAVIDEEGT